jgi:integrase
MKKKLLIILGAGSSVSIQRREDHWAIVDLVGKAGRVRTVPVPAWVKTAVDKWAESVPVVSGKLFRSIRKNGTVWGDGIKQNVVWYVVKACADRANIKALAPHDLRSYAESRIMPNPFEKCVFGVNLPHWSDRWDSA